jgi:hypothetical protein
MAAVVVVFRHDIEQERFHIVVERLGTQKQLCEKTKILAIHRVLSAIDFEKRVFAIAIDLVARRVLSRALEL